MRTVCKAVQAKGCERSGRAVAITDFVRGQGVQSIPLAPFRGNRFNILFYNGGGVFFLLDQLKSFFEWMKEENKLLKAVYHDLEVASFVAGCRALGLVDKLVTGPLWRVLEKKDVGVLDMSDRYQQLLRCFEAWSADASPILKGEGLVFQDISIHKDDCLEKLITPSAYWDAMTQQVLELMFGSFVVVTKRMLSDHLEGGKYDKPDQVTAKECKNAPKSNVVPERDFGMLDRLMVMKPNATTMVYEGILLFTKNNTRQWRDNLTPEKRILLLQLARDSKKCQRALYIERKAAIRKKREEKLAMAREEKERKILKERLMKEELMQKVENLGGLWKTASVVDEKLEEVGGEKEQKVALRAQLLFRKIVLGAPHLDKALFQMSTGGKQYTAEKMGCNLKEVIKRMDDEKNSLVAPLTGTTTNGTTTIATGPTVISREKFEQQKLKYKQLAEQEVIKAGKKRSTPNSEARPKPKKRKSLSQSEDAEKIPTITTPEELVGKKV